MLAVLLLGALILGAGGLHAQESVVVQAGAGLGRLWGTPEDLPKESRVSARAEAALLFPLSSNVAIQVGAGYARESGTEGGLGLDYTLTVDFVQVPILVRVGPTEGRFAPHLVAGPTVALSVHCEIRQETSGPGGPQLDVFGCGDEGGAVELGALVGIGLDTRLSDRTALVLELIHARVLTPVDSRRLKSWSLVAGMRWDLG